MSTIATVTATAVNVPMVAPYRFSFGSLASFTTTLVEVTDTDAVSRRTAIRWRWSKNWAGAWWVSPPTC
jgi:hypothetical protein